MNRYTSPWTLNTDGPPKKLISLACILAKHNVQLYLWMSRRNWRQFVALDVSKPASGSGGSGIGHNVTLPSLQRRLSVGLLQLLLDRRSSRKKRA